jgi:hypothetical protein
MRYAKVTRPAPTGLFEGGVERESAGDSSRAPTVQTYADVRNTYRSGTQLYSRARVISIRHWIGTCLFVRVHFVAEISIRFERAFPGSRRSFAWFSGERVQVTPGSASL